MSLQIERESDIPDAERAVFWDLVKIGLLILRADPGLFDRYKAVHDASSDRARAFNYHSCPLNIAADLTGIGQPTAEQYAVYQPIETYLFGQLKP